MCNSEWKKGATFTYVIALDKMTSNISGVQRVRNPLQKTY